MSFLPLLETERLLLRPSSMRLLRPITEFYEHNADWLQQFEPEHEPGFKTRAYQRNLIGQDVRLAKEGESLRYWLFRKDDPETAVGCVALNDIVLGARRSCCIAYKLDQRMQHLGYASEAVNTLTDFAFSVLRLHRVEACIMPRNQASLALAQRCGFEREGVSRKYICINGVWEDHVHMVRLEPGEGERPM